MRLLFSAAIMALTSCQTTVYLREDNQENSTGVVAVRGYRWSHEYGPNEHYRQIAEYIMKEHCEDGSHEIISTAIEPTHAGLDLWLPCIIGLCVLHTGAEEFRIRFHCKALEPIEKQTTKSD